MEKRRSAFIEASAKDKSDFFRTHLALYLARHAELTNDQKRIILEGMSLATPESYEVPSSSPDWKAKFGEPMMQFESRVRTAFSRDEGAKIFATLGYQEGQDGLLQKYRDLSALAMQKRRATFRKGSPKDRSDLWRTHLAIYLANHPELNEGQKEVILEGMSLAMPALFETRPDWKTNVEGQLRSLENRALTVFSKGEGARIFATLGDVEPATAQSDAGALAPPKNPDSVKTSNPKRMLNRFVAQDMELTAPDCECTRESDWCYNYCSGHVPPCNYQQSGCGTFWQYQCTGMCH
jgi:hypothetical protein